MIVAGRDVVAMTLAELSLPGARMIWTDFRQSASLGRLHGTVEAAGGLDRMVLAADGAESEDVFSVMCAVLCFLPALRRRPGSEVRLVVTEGPAVASLRAFLDRIAPRVARDGVTIRLTLREAVA